MPPIYLLEQGTKLHKESRRLVVKRDEEEIFSVPIIKVDRVYIFGNVGLTTPALTWLMEQNIDVVFCTQYGQYKGRVVGQSSGHSHLRRLQYRRVDNTIFAVNTARAIIKGKLHNSRVLLQRYQRRFENTALLPAIDRLAELIDRADRSQTVNSLMGVEGMGAAVYFEVFPLLIKYPDKWQFTKRVRRPPTDPVNVLLSFGYTLLTRQIEAAVEMVGLDPYLGCLHADSYNRPSLALDLTEEFRSIIVDSVVLRCLNNDLILPENFSRQDDPERPVLLDDAGRKRFIEEFEARLAVSFVHPHYQEQTTWRRCFELQARTMAQIIQSDGLYRPFLVR